MENLEKVKTLLGDSDAFIQWLETIPADSTFGCNTFTCPLATWLSQSIGGKLVVVDKTTFAMLDLVGAISHCELPAWAKAFVKLYDDKVFHPLYDMRTRMVVFKIMPASTTAGRIVAQLKECYPHVLSEA